MRLNLGCGSIRPVGWVNVDCSWNALAQKIPGVGPTFAKYVLKTQKYDSDNFTYMNLNRKWPYADGAIEVVYASHFFEHLSISKAKLLLQEAFRCLKPEGVIRLIVPDLYQVAKNYVEAIEAGERKASETLLYVMNLHQEGAYPAGDGFRHIIGSLQRYPHQHKYMYDRFSLGDMLQAHGFRDVVSSSYGASHYLDGAVKDVEYSPEGIASIYLEAKK